MPKFWRRSMLPWLTVVAMISIVGCSNSDEPKGDSAVVRPAVPMWGLQLGMHVTEFDANANGLTFDRMISYGKSPTYACKIAGDDAHRLLVTFTSEDNDGLRLKQIAKVDAEKTLPDLIRPDVSPVKLDGLYFGMKLKEFKPDDYGLEDYDDNWEESDPDYGIPYWGSGLAEYQTRQIENRNIVVVPKFEEGYIRTNDCDNYLLTEIRAHGYLKQIPVSFEEFRQGGGFGGGGGQF